MSGANSLASIGYDPREPHSGPGGPDKQPPRKTDALVAAQVAKPAELHKRHEAASKNELATAIAAAEDVVDPHAAPRNLANCDEHSHREACPACVPDAKQKADAKRAALDLHRAWCPYCNPTLDPRFGDKERERFGEAARGLLQIMHHEAANLPMKAAEKVEIYVKFLAALPAYLLISADVDSDPFCPTCGSGLTFYLKPVKADPDTGSKGHHGGWSCANCGGFDECEAPADPGDTDS